MKRSPDFEQPSGGPLGVPELPKLSYREIRRQVPSAGSLALPPFPRSHRREDPFVAHETRKKGRTEEEERVRAISRYGEEIGPAYADLVQDDGSYPEESDLLREHLATMIENALVSSHHLGPLRASRALVDLALRVPHHDHIEPRMK